MRSPVNASPIPSRVSAHRLGVDAVRYSFIVMDLHHLLLAGLPAHSGLPLETDIVRAGRPCLKGANNRLMHRSNYQLYSITSSARASSEGGMVRPSAFAVLRLITSSNCVACCTGSSLGLAPPRIFATWPPNKACVSREAGPV